MQDDDVWPGLGDVFRSVFGNAIPPVQEELSPRDIKAWDSFNHLNLLMAVESRWNVTFSEEELRTIASAGDIATLVRRKRQSASV